MGTPSTQQHVPAWKRIGLKLKYARDTAEDEAPENSFPANALGISIGGERHTPSSVDDGRPSKKRRTLSNGSREQSHARPSEVKEILVEESTQPASIASQAVVVSTEPAVEPRKSEYDKFLHPQRQSNRNGSSSLGPEAEPRRKSVTFTPETKQDDGFSAGNFSKEWAASQSPTGTTALIKASSPNKQPKENNQSDRKKKGKGEPRSSHVTKGEARIAREPTSDGQEYVKYLQRFHKERSAWKFNKKRQKDLLKNLFNVDRVPIEHNEAILEYLQGLQGSGARQRVVEDATAVLKEIAEKVGFDGSQDMESEEARRDAYTAALHRQIELFDSAGGPRSEYDDDQIEEMKQEAERGRRAEAVLGELLRNELRVTQHDSQGISQTSEQNQDANHAAQPFAPNSTMPDSKAKSARKKRKARTQASPTPSSDGNAVDEGKFHPSRGPATVSNALKVDPYSSTNGLGNKAAGVKFSGTKTIFDDDLLDKAFPKRQKFNK